MHKALLCIFYSKFILIKKIKNLKNIKVEKIEKVKKL